MILQMSQILTSCSLYITLIRGNLSLQFFLEVTTEARQEA